MQQSRAKYQRHLFEETRAVPAVRFPRDVQEALRQAPGAVASNSGEEGARGGRR